MTTYRVSAEVKLAYVDVDVTKETMRSPRGLESRTKRVLEELSDEELATAVRTGMAVEGVEVDGYFESSEDD